MVCFTWSAWVISVRISSSSVVGSVLKRTVEIPAVAITARATTIIRIGQPGRRNWSVTAFYNGAISPPIAVLGRNPGGLLLSDRDFDQWAVLHHGVDVVALPVAGHS